MLGKDDVLVSVEDFVMQKCFEMDFDYEEGNELYLTAVDGGGWQVTLLFRRKNLARIFLSSAGLALRGIDFADFVRLDNVESPLQRYARSVRHSLSGQSLGPGLSQLHFESVHQLKARGTLQF